MGVDGFILARPGGRRVHSGSLGAFGRAIAVVGIIRVGLVHAGAPWGRWVHSGWLGSFGCALVALSASFVDVGFIPARPGGHRIHSDSSGSFGRALGVARGVILRHRHGSTNSTSSITTIYNCSSNTLCGTSHKFDILGDSNTSSLHFQ